VKTLIIIRHAKSDQQLWSNDFERPLNERGKTDAPLMGKRLKERQPVIDAFVASPAKRAKKTAELFAKAFGKSGDEIIFISSLYHAPPVVFYEEIQRLPDSVNIVAVFAHNPGITAFVNELTTMKIDNMPTCAVFAVQVNTTQWRDFVKAEKEFLFFDYPKLMV
jgi:phosphohistidine phosphatase